MKLPNKLRIKNGTLFCADGQDVAEYLNNWVVEVGIDENTPLSLLVRQDVVELFDEKAYYEAVACVG